MVAVSGTSRRERLMPGGVPRYVEVYDNAHPKSQVDRTIDRFFVVFTGKRGGPVRVMSLSPDPSWSRDAGIDHLEDERPDRPRYKHLGYPVEFEDLPKQCRRRIREAYEEFWDLDGD